ncbi:DNA topoisomerase (ATP-hydrolyzing) [Mycoplasma phocoenae]|uniref:DNA topoisomerase (ATP-hydrolyzing) n=1 Tax=Mycoplasma phocoenae TaxID=754517 RepID=A0A858U6Z3_9MOLU|nr:DNA topoisomerase (ATP-hydrolyzing) [Mycoplasma phocoenae]QJG67035.1 DNA topoisomerase 4 subunit A [Mycoplasma phocoenae]
MAKKQNEIIEKIINQSLDNIMSNGFSRYSKYVIQNRALPDARDGLKPVQRRILFSMWEMGLTHDKSFKKSARVVGDVIGRFHPHGDSSIYDALIRMSQEWKIAYPLINMHGNKGSIDDDPAAAMRYTETKLEKISNLLLGEIDKKIVSFAPNFDDTEYEPVVLPTMFPNLLANGSSGIAVGMATNIPPHNLNELLLASIELIKNPNVSDESLLKIIKGPDFPTGGIVSDIDGFIEAFKTGRGRISMYAKTEFIKNKNDQVIGIEITEIPFGIVKIDLIKDIQNLIYNKSIDGIKDISDHSSREGINIFIELDKDVNPDAILNYLFQKTKLKEYYNYNMVAIDNNTPKLMGIKQLLITYVSHIRNNKKLSLEYDKEKLSRRLEIVLGLIRVSEISDAIIKVIREAEGSKKGVIQSLMSNFDFTELQATAIAELRLYKLSKMDQEQYIKESEDLKRELNRITILLENDNEFKKFLISILKNMIEEFGIERRSIISSENIDTKVETKDLVKKEDFYLYVSVDNYVKKISTKIYQSNQLSTFGLKESDVIQFGQLINTLSKILFITSKGNYFVINGFDFKDNQWKDMGDHISDYVALDDDENIIKVVHIEEFGISALMLIISKKGLAKRINLNELSLQTNRKFNCMKLKTKYDSVISAQMCRDDKYLLLILNNGLYNLFEQSQVPIYSLKASGITAIKTGVNEIKAALIVSEKDKIILANDRGQFKRMLLKNIPEVKRQNVAKVLYYDLKSKPSTLADVTTQSDGINYYYINKDNELSVYDPSEVPISSIRENFSNPKIETKYKGSFIKPFVLDDNATEYIYSMDKNTTDIAREDIEQTQELIIDKDIEELNNKEVSSQEKISNAEFIDIDSLIAKAKNFKK